MKTALFWIFSVAALGGAVGVVANVRNPINSALNLVVSMLALAGLYVLLEAHSAVMGLTFYDGRAFPKDYRGDAFAALHFVAARRLARGFIIIIDYGHEARELLRQFGMPFREEKGRLWGPGVLDMKSGLAFFVFAIRALRDLDSTYPVAMAYLQEADRSGQVGRALR